MQSSTVISSWKKLLHICWRNKIFKTCLIDDKDLVLQYGSLGSLLKRNIFSIWLSSFINSNEVTILPSETVNSLRRNDKMCKTPEKADNGLLKSVVGNYFEFNYLLEDSAPIGFAAYGPCYNEFDKNVKPCEEIDFKLKNFKSCTHLSMVFFSPPKQSINWFHYWSKQRYLWWRKFSSIPSKFSMSEVRNIQTHAQQLSLLFQFPWGDEPLESITFYENKCIQNEFQNYCSENGLDYNHSSTPSVVICETGLDLAVLAYLSNSYAEHWRGGQLKNILHLHYKLVPYKVCILLETEKSEILKRLKAVASHLSKELQNSGILLFPTLDAKFATQIESAFNNFDEIGVPYVIVLNEISLQSGVAGLRNRDTTLQEQVHITELTSKLVKYLKY